MSTTRKALPGEPPSWEKHMSSSEFADERGLPGAAVTAKAALLTDARERSLLYFLQALSCPNQSYETPEFRRRGGLKRLAAEIIAAFPERLGTPTMHRLGIKPGRIYSQSEMEEMDEGLGAPLDFMGISELEYVQLPKQERTCEHLLSLCKEKSLCFDGFLGELCTNPRVSIEGASWPYLRDVIGALFEFQERHAEKARGHLADTTVARQVFSTLDRALRRGKMVVIEGEPGVGKTKAVETWCEMHLGEARFVTISGVVNKTSIFHKMELALGLSFGLPKKSTQMQAAVESMLKRSGLMLVIDEAHYCWGQGERITARPEIIDWIDTSCCNEGVPVTLVATPQLRERLAHIERRTLWQSKQFRRRINAYVPLAAKTSTADAEAVARKLLPEGGAAAIKLLMGFAELSQYPLTYIRNAVEDARDLAREDGRSRVEFRDIDRAIQEFRVPSELAQNAVFGEQPKRNAPARQRASASAEAAEEFRFDRFPGHRKQIAARVQPGSNASARRPGNGASVGRL